MVSEDNVLIYLVRHGETTLNKEKKFRGPANPPLDEEGFRQANRLAEYFSRIDVAAIFASPRKRTSATAGIIGLKLGIKPIENDGLVAWNIGDFGGKPKTDENKARLHYYVEHPDIPPPGGVSLNQFRAQVHPLLEDGFRLSDESCKPILWVVHSSVVHEASAYVTGDHGACKIKPGGVAAIYIGPGNMLYAEPILKPDKSAATQNILGTHHPHVDNIS